MTEAPGQVLDCGYYAAGRCRSCTWLPTPYDVQLATKDEATRRALAAVLGDRPAPDWLPPVASRTESFRSKAKMVVAGTVEEPTLGILDPHGAGVDLRGCALHVPAIQEALPVLAAFVRRAGLTPYDVASALPVPQRGELKHVLVTAAPDGELMVRWVLRSTAALDRIRKHLPWLRAELPTVAVVTVNVQPDHRAILEGDREIVLTEQSTLPMPVNDVTLLLGPRSFFQTNTEIAAALYRRAREWVAELDPATVWDLYCGVGGFALHLAAPGRAVTGVEVSADAIAAAGSAAVDRPGTLRFLADDATAFAVSSDAGQRPDLVVVNPPRRGLGAELAGWLETSGVPHLLYSSCNPETLARDLATLASYDVVRGQIFDMFPHTGHAEVLVLLARR